METGYVVVMVTAPTEEEAASIGRTVVEEGLAACCNIVPRVRSIYTWQDKVCDEDEVLCLMKTRKALFSGLKDRIIELHSYDVPEVISLDIEGGHRDYLSWIDDVTRG